MVHTHYCLLFSNQFSKKRFTNLLLFALIIGLFPLQSAIGKPKKPKNVIVIIGDGTGLAQWSALSAHYQYRAFSAAAGTDRNALREKLDRDNVCVFNRFPVCGLSQTYSANNYITDSGAGGTAIAGGSKTNNYAIGVDESGKAMPSLAAIAKENGKATGIVVTCELTHATPAAFYAHQPKRSLMSDIAKDLLTTNSIDVAIGGGYPYLKPFNYQQHTVFASILQSGRTYPSKLDSIDHGLSNGSQLQRTILLYNQDTFPPKAHQGRDGYLERASVAAMRELNKNSNGYFLMIEGSQVDWAGHENDSAYLMAELIDLDRTILAVMNEVEQHQRGETLIVVTADHETGGLSLVGWDKKNGCAKLAWSTHDHTGIPVPVFAFGPGSEQFTGTYQNNDIFHKLLPFVRKKK